ncbi:hypothetical protein ACSL103130_12195 [Actinomyces slackii]|uniref:Uncharacterized protein n=1 Tax=Actinomyces slackii TaxID=52774 RepID=A0A3S4SDF7_9ACTO|nr:hypothetical protein [Actinomyces slackii]VEG73514.1 Uncharacterised protein [Actinomyces slackii]
MPASRTSIPATGASRARKSRTTIGAVGLTNLAVTPQRDRAATATTTAVAPRALVPLLSNRLALPHRDA